MQGPRTSGTFDVETHAPDPGPRQHDANETLTAPSYRLFSVSSSVRCLSPVLMSCWTASSGLAQERKAFSRALQELSNTTLPKGCDSHIHYGCRYCDIRCHVSLTRTCRSVAKTPSSPQSTAVKPQCHFRW